MNEAVSLGRDGSVADGFWAQSVGLPFPVVCFDIDLFAFNHSEVTSDKNGSLGSFRALCARALAKTNKNLDCVFVHVNSIFFEDACESGAAFREYIIRLSLNKQSTRLKRMLC